MVFKDKDKNGHFDLESIEMYIRSSMHNAGCIMLEKLLNADGGDYKGRTIPYDNGNLAEFVDYREKDVLTVLGNVKIKRAYYYDKECGKGCCPKDKALDIERTSFSPGIRRIMGRVGAYMSFGLGQEDIKEIAGINLTAKEIERESNKLGVQAEEFYQKEAHEAQEEMTDKIIPIKTIPKMYICMDGTGVPVVKQETVNKRGKGEDGQAKTREVKLGCVFTQSKLNKKGHPVRDEESTSFAGAIETAEKFGSRIYAEANRRGLAHAEKVCVIGDGAVWIWNIAEEQFYGAIQIIDLYHAKEHCWNVGRVFFGNNKNSLNEWAAKRCKELEQGKVEQVIEAIKQLNTRSKEEKDLFEKEMNYFDKNKDRMRYDNFRKQGLFVGSGMIEAGCKTVIGQRLKQSGMHWTVRGANNIIALRCCYFSNRWEDFWEYRASA